jgi:uncharacterized membrane protein YeaQ/YmgE (transglycosylase-associated protein family)
MSTNTRNIIVWIILGILAGWIASLIVGGGGNLLWYLLVGVIGSIIGGFLARAFNLRLRLGSAFIDQMVVSILGAIVFLILWRIIF